MAEKKQALLLFSKPPVSGRVKTRLTIEHGGFMTPDEAADFYKRCLYDVSELCMHSLIEMQRANDAAVAADPSVDKITYDFFVSTPAADIDIMKATYDEIGPWPMEIHYLTDKGATFDDHFDYAFKQIFDEGYEHIVSVGGDIPTLPKHAARRASCRRPARSAARRWWASATTRPSTTRASTTTWTVAPRSTATSRS